MEIPVDESDQKSQQTQVVQEVESGLSGVGFGIVFVILVLLVLNYFNILRLYQIFPSLSFLPHLGKKILSETPIRKPPPIDSCMVRVHDYPLIYDVTETGNIITGQYRGTLQSIDTSGNQIHVTILSTDGKESHTFSMNKNLPFYDAVHATKIPLSDFHQGQYVGISFNCDKSRGNQFAIFDMGIQQI